MTPLNRLLEELHFVEAHPVFVTGAGISIASGIAPFRGTADAVWENDVLEKGTYDFFLRHPDQSMAWFLSRFDKCRAQPGSSRSGHHRSLGKEQESPLRPHHAER